MVRTLLDVSTCGTKAHFATEFVEFAPNNKLNKEEARLLDRMRLDSISNSDLHYRRRHTNQDDKLNQIVRIGCYWAMLPLSDLEIDVEGERISINWKTLMNDLFGLYAHAAHLGGKEVETAAFFEEELRTRIFWPGRDKSLAAFVAKTITPLIVEDFGVHKQYLVRAYIARLRRAHKAARKPFSLTKPWGSKREIKVLDTIYDDIAIMRSQRNRHLVDNFRSEA